MTKKTASMEAVFFFIAIRVFFYNETLCILLLRFTEGLAHIY